MNKLTEITFQSETTTHYCINIGEHSAEGIEVRLLDSDCYFLFINCKHGILACRIASLEDSERLNLPIAIFSAARLDDILAGKPRSLSQAAIARGADMDMTGTQLVELFSSGGN